MFIAFCGIDGSGKSTHMKAILDWLHTQGVKAISHKVIFEEVDHIAKEYEKKEKDMFSLKSKSLLYAYEVCKASNQIQRWLDEDYTVLLDRWTYSHWAYAYAYGIENKELNHILEQCLVPDMVFLFHLPVDEALKRIQQRGIEGVNETKFIMNKACEKYNVLGSKKNFIHMNSLDTFDYNQQVIKDHVNSFVCKAGIKR
ncbi:dTMP kinase [Paenibacillus massiliensis]|uniref:dTMP kinase n=1 Tax=Paenibacillus massiliensis TaxID=225917 RepID=UPI0004231759|nr:AAA family ATPase [Paenibacillus massiliensis]